MPMFGPVVLEIACGFSIKKDIFELLYTEIQLLSVKRIKVSSDRSTLSCEYVEQTVYHNLLLN